MSGRTTGNRSKKPTKPKTNQMPTLEMQFVSTSKRDATQHFQQQNTKQRPLP